MFNSVVRGDLHNLILILQFLVGWIVPLQSVKVIRVDKGWGQVICVFFLLIVLTLISCTSLWGNKAVLRCIWLVHCYQVCITESEIQLSLERHPKPINVRDAFHSSRLWLVLLWRDFIWVLSYFNGYNHALLNCSQILMSVQVKLWLFSIKLGSSFLFTPSVSKYMDIPTPCQACGENKSPNCMMDVNSFNFSMWMV